MSIAKKIIVRGRVQGVGFRYTTTQLAKELGVTGTVWNESDGSVHIEAQAEESVLKEFISKVDDSPSPYGRVDSLNVTDIAVNENRNKFREI
ncbi:acylphosphatase [Weissella bombi]|uniref:acylphosphatase n=1 Tax=Weissella bombi TaxID=1505725 RepID=A0A1C3ZPR5_9LACO|nr:acylphosphatase [Weissella bombi]